MGPVIYLFIYPFFSNRYVESLPSHRTLRFCRTIQRQQQLLPRRREVLWPATRWEHRHPVQRIHQHPHRFVEQSQFWRLRQNYTFKSYGKLGSCERTSGIPYVPESPYNEYSSNCNYILLKKGARIRCWRGGGPGLSLQFNQRAVSRGCSEISHLRSLTGCLLVAVVVIIWLLFIRLLCV